MSASPTQCVEEFYSALVKHDLAAARGFVWGAREGEWVDKAWGQFPSEFVIEVDSEEVMGEEARVEFRISSSVKGTGALADGAFCVRREGRWYLDADPLTPTDGEPGFSDMIRLFQGGAPDAYMAKHQSASMVSMCSQRVRLLGQALITLSIHTDCKQMVAPDDLVEDTRGRYPGVEVIPRSKHTEDLKTLSRAEFQARYGGENHQFFPFTPESWKDVVLADEHLKAYRDGLPYGLFECTCGSPISLNENLCGRYLREVKDPAKTVLVHEGEGGRLAFNHEGKAHVFCVALGVSSVSPVEAEALIWTLD